MSKIVQFQITMLFIMVGFYSSAQPNWTVNPAAFEFTMTMSGVGVFQCVESTDANDIVGAFIDDEVRGVQKFNVDFNGRKYAFMIIYDNVFSGNEVTFKLYDASEDTIFPVLDSIVFEENSNIGGVGDPFEFKTNYDYLELFLTRDTMYSTDTAGTVVSEIFAVNENMDTLSIDFDFVDDTLGADNSYFFIPNGQLIIKENVNLELIDSLRVHLSGSDSSGCSIDAAFVLTVVDSVTVDVLDLEVENVNPAIIYPNPISSNTLFFDAVQQIDLVSVYDLTGRLILKEWVSAYSGSVDISGLESQIYVIVFESKELKWGKKVFVER